MMDPATGVMESVQCGANGLALELAPRQSLAYVKRPETRFSRFVEVLIGGRHALECVRLPGTAVSAAKIPAPLRPAAIFFHESCNAI